MRISEFYNLNRTQPTLDFVDAPIDGDVSVFIDPRALRCLPSDWGARCIFLIQSFFHTVLHLIKNKEDKKARELLATLREPNETHLGLSKGAARGRGLGRDSARDVWKALSESQALHSGLLEDLEDAILMIEGISSDIISDMTTNIIRLPLIEYTNRIAGLYGIPLNDSVNSGPFWDAQERTWKNNFVKLPTTNHGKLLLIPKAIVRQKMDYDVDEYYRDYLLEHLRGIELDANSELVQLLKSGGRRITQKDLIAKFGRGKSMIVRETQKHPEVLERYRNDKRKKFSPPLGHSAIALADGTSPPNWDQILEALQQITPGRTDAADFERCVEQLISALFYPALTNPDLQTPIHQGRKRIDLTYTNVAHCGFFHWIGQHYTAPNVFIECKNYTDDPANPELDQLSGRFSKSRGEFGIIVARIIADKKLFMNRCRDTAQDGRGYIIFLDDNDLIELVKEKKEKGDNAEYKLLTERFRGITL